MRLVEKHADGTWGSPRELLLLIKLDDTMNTLAHEWCPMVTPDGK
jgi:hypothetical protein